MAIVDNKYTFQIIGTDKTKKTFLSITKQTRSLVNNVGKFSVGMGAGLLLITQRTIAANTEMSRLAQSVGVSTQALSEWSHAGKIVNIEGDKMADIFKDVSDKIGDLAVTGGGEAVDMFEKLNLDLKEMVKLSPDQQLVKIGDALDGVSTRSEKIFFLEALASDASRLLPLLEDDAELLKEMQKEARDLGVSLNDVDAAKMEAAQRSMERVSAMARGASNELASSLAPIIEVVSNKLVDAGKEAGGMSAIVQRGFKVGTKIAGIFANGLHGVRIIFKGLEIVAKGLNFVLIGGFTKLLEIVASLHNALVKGVAEPIRGILRLAAPFSAVAADALKNVDDLVSSMQVRVPKGMHAFADAQAEAFDIARGELHSLLMEDLPGNVIKANIETILSEADALARQRVAEMRNRVKQDTGAGVDTSSTTDPLAAEREELALRVQMLGEHDNLEFLRLEEKFLSEQTLLQEALDKQAITEETHKSKLLSLEDSFTRRKRALKAKEMKAEFSMTAGFLNNMIAVAGGSQKRIFKMQKKVALAKALVSLPPAIIQSYNNAGGFPFGIPAALAMAAKGLLEIRNIKKTNIGSSGGGSSGGSGGGASVPVPNLNLPGIPNAPQQNEAAGKNVVIQISAENIVSDDPNIADWIIDKIKPAIDEQDAVLFDNPGSAQAQLLGVGA